MNEQLNLFGLPPLVIPPDGAKPELPIPPNASSEAELSEARRKLKAKQTGFGVAAPALAPLEAAEIPSFPTKLLPPVMRDIIQETSRGHLIPEALPAACALAAISEVLGAGLVVQSDPAGNGSLAGNLFIMGVAESGTGKGRGYTEIIQHLDELATAESEGWEANVRPVILADVEEQHAIIARVKKTLTKATDSTERVAMKEEMKAAKSALASLEQQLGKAPVWNAGEATREALARLAAGQVGEAISSRSGEARGILSVLAGRYAKGNESDEDIFLHLYSRDPKTINRQGSPPIQLKRPTGTVLWLIQPDKARELLGMANMTESGLLPRFITFDSGAQAEDVPEVRHQISESSRQAWADLLACLASTFRANGENPKLVVPCPEAFELFRTFDNETRAARREGGEYKDIAPFAARWAENAWRIALVLHAAIHRTKAANQPLSLQTTQSAIALQRWFIDGQLRLLSTGRNSRRSARLETLCNLLTKGPLTLRDLSNSHGFSKAEVQALAKNSLIEVITLNTGGRPSPVARIRSRPPA